MKNVPLLIGTLLGTVLLVVVIAFFFSGSTQPQTVDQALLMHTAHNFRGPDNAKVTVVEFSDFQCPACKAAEPLVEQLLAKYPNDMRLVYRNFPLIQIHQWSKQAATAGEAAAQSGKFWEFHDLMFQTQEEWASLSDEKQVMDKFAEYAAKVQIDKNEFNKKIESQEVTDQVATDIADGTKAGIDATPTFFVNGKKVLAPQLESAVESAISQPAK